MKINRKTILILGAVILLGGLVFYYAVGGKLGMQANGGDSVGSDTNNKESVSVDSIVAEHSYEAGLHTVSGTVDLPNSCYELLVEAEVRESFPEQVSLNFYQINTASSDSMCAQVITSRSFNVSFSASQEAKITANTANRSLDLRLTELE